MVFLHTSHVTSFQTSHVTSLHTSQVTSLPAGHVVAHAAAYAAACATASPHRPQRGRVRPFSPPHLLHLPHLHQQVPPTRRPSHRTAQASDRQADRDSGASGPLPSLPNPNSNLHPHPLRVEVEPSPSPLNRNPRLHPHSIRETQHQLFLVPTTLILSTRHTQVGMECSPNSLSLVLTFISHSLCDPSPLRVLWRHSSRWTPNQCKKLLINSCPKCSGCEALVG